MAYGKNPDTKKNSKKSIAQETLELFKLYEDKRDHWATQAREDQEYRLGRQLTKEQEETLKVTWFVSSGKLKNRTAKETKWLEAEKGEQTILFAIYPRKSQFFNWTAKKVIIE